jgi:ribosomal protein S17
VLKNSILLILGISVLMTTIFILKKYSHDMVKKSQGAASVILALSLITIGGAIYFYMTSAPYAIFKLQTWFMPLLIPVYIYGIKLHQSNKHFFLIKTICMVVLGLNLTTSTVYLLDQLKADQDKQFSNVRAVTNNHDIESLVANLKSNHVSRVSLFLTNGIESAWLADAMRTMTLNKITHNLQPLEDRELPAHPCQSVQADDVPLNMIVTPAQTFSRSDIVAPPVGAKMIYANAQYNMLDMRQVQSFMYLGRGVYPVEIFDVPGNNAFPKRFRWVEKGAELYIYSREDKIANLMIEVTPGFVVTKEPRRTIVVKTPYQQYHYSITQKTMLTIPNVKLHKGLSCLMIESPDEILPSARYAALLRAHVPLDPRVNNFAMSYVGMTS